MNYAQFRITVPWPDKALSPNARVHWARKSKATKEARAVAMLMTRSWIAANGQVDPDATLLRYTFYPRTNARRDDDNLVASMKATRDGIAAGLGQNDFFFATARPVVMPADKENPRVEIELSNPL